MSGKRRLQLIYTDGVSPGADREPEKLVVPAENLVRTVIKLGERWTYGSTADKNEV